ncbi:hypothetical protein JYT13_01295 [Mariprofundus ferrooxydans]|nr:hypothetical protein [Mariprofundus ferrooxydans]
MSNSMQQTASRQTLATSPASPAPFRIIMLSLPLWGASLLLMLFMPLTGFIGFILIAIYLVYLPFKAKCGACPACQTLKIFPFSGFGSTCKGCHYELVLRGSDIHQIEKKDHVRYGSGRSQTQQGKP